MEFLNPGMLILAGAAAAPVILHLIMRQAPKHIVFPALRFIRQRQESNRRRFRLRHLLLLLLRAMALALLAFALARPSLTASGLSASQESPVTAVLVIDTSPTMAYEEENRTRLQEAQEIAGWLLDEIPSESQVAVIDSRIDSNVFQVDLSEARKFVSELNVTNVPSRFDSAIEAAWKLVKTGDHDAKEIYIFTDLARGGWPSESATRLAEFAKENPGVGVQVVDVGMPDPQNTRLSRLQLSKQTIAPSQDVRMRVGVERIGQVNQSSAQLYLVDETGAANMVDQKSINFGPGGSAEVEFLLRNLKTGTHQGEVRLSSSDKLAIDDRRYFTIEAKPPWPVLLAAPGPQDNVDYIVDPLYNALAPELYRQRKQESFDGKALDQAQIPAAELSQYAVVALVDPRPVSTDAWEELRKYVENGGSLAIFLGRNAGNGESFNTPAAQAVMPGELAEVATWPGRDVHLDTLENRAAMLTNLRDFEVPWSEIWIYRAWKFKGLYEGVRTIAQYTNQEPAILERVVGKGRVIVMTTPVSDDIQRPDDRNYQGWNSLVNELIPWPFVVLVNEMFYDLAGKTDETLNFLAAPGMTAVLHVSRDAGIFRYQLTPPEGKPSFRDTNPADERILISSIEEIGNYRLELKEKGFERGFSVNLSAEQTDLERIETSTIAAFFGGREIPVARSTDELKRNVTFTHYGQELFPWLMIIIVIVTGVEHVLANRFYGMREPPAEEKPLWARLGDFPSQGEAGASPDGVPPADTNGAEIGAPDERSVPTANV